MPAAAADRGALRGVGLGDLPQDGRRDSTTSSPSRRKTEKPGSIPLACQRPARRQERPSAEQTREPLLSSRLKRSAGVAAWAASSKTKACSALDANSTFGPSSVLFSSLGRQWMQSSDSAIRISFGFE